MPVRRARLANGDRNRGVNGDRPPLTDWPILGQRCRPEDIYRLLKYSRERFGTGHVDTFGLTDAATRSLEIVQEELRHRESTIDRAAAIELLFAHRWTIDAIRWVYDDKTAKEIEIKVARGRPLAVCVGGGKGRDVDTILGTFHVCAHGCFRIFESVTRASGRMWPQLCPDCRPRNGKRQPLRTAERALLRRVAQRVGTRSVKVTEPYRLGGATLDQGQASDHERARAHAYPR